MLQLRIQQHPLEEGRHRVEVALEGDGARRTAKSTFAFSLSPQDEEDLRWYLEDFLQYPQEPAPTIARRVEGRMAEVGTELFQAVFQASDDSRRIWSKVEERLPETRIEIVTGVTEAATIPWELLREPSAEAVLALTAHSFVRAQPDAARAPRPPARKKGKIRILLVLCRPRGEKDVPFRSVASQLLRGLSEANREAYDLDLLRPPTFEQLGKVLREAHRRAEPYHVVHFDGHGTFTEIKSPGALGALLGRLTSIVLAGQREGKHGYLWFENPQLEDKGDLVDGTSLGKLLADTGVPVLVLNACRSAHTEPSPKPAAEDPHSKVRAFGSLAQEVMDQGVAGVVAMRYNVYVVTAARLAAELYASLARGAVLGEAVTLARKNLSDNPLREVVHAPLPLQDWTVPVVYEAAPLQVFPKAKDDGNLTIHVEAGAAASAAGSLDPSLPPPPDAGFFGRDETLLALDRAFDKAPIVLLHAYAGSGKTTTAAEFARWYSLTGGVDGPVLFTTFERYLPLPRVLDRIGQVFGPALENAGIHWLALDDSNRRQVALQVLSQVPVLWIWDNVEPVTGFPTGTQSAWSAEEQAELLGFLRDLRGTKAKVLLTSRRDEDPWLGNLPVRIQVPPMPMTESLQLVRALAERHGRKLADVEDWRPLLAFAQGNPLTLTVLAGQALRKKLKIKEEIEAFVARLRSGEADFSDEINEGRSRFLGASLAYGFEQAFSEEERKKLALLHLFQGFVDVEVLRVMGNPEAPWCLPEVRGLTREEGIALLDRAAEVGLLATHGGGYYGIHPALPWFFKSLFERCHPAGDVTAVWAFVEAVGELGNYYWAEYQHGNRDVIGALRAEEANLLHARRLARTHGWWDPVIYAMQGLRQLYGHTGRRAEWKRLVEEIVPDFIDPKSDGPLPRQEERWSLVTEYRVLLAQEERQWTEAERLQTVCMDWDRQRAAPALARPAGEMEDEERQTIRTLAVSLEALGHIRRESGRAECVPVYEEALELYERFAYRVEAAVCALNLGHAFNYLPALRDLHQAEGWYRRSLDLRDERDRMGRGRCMAQLGSVAYARFLDARTAERPEEELLLHLNEAVRRYQEALELLPVDAVDDLAVAHNQLGAIFGDAGHLDRSVQHFREAIHHAEAQGDLYGAAMTRFNVALTLLRAGRRADALEYAEAALRGFEPYEAGAANEIEKTRGLIAYIRGA
ncbi:MAG TPA: CHAT domain-containing protein [Thermoanaerobaculia bacterium]|nr:CHAT domain-containing protein [Thermoanaerobaculia bacterium]